MTPGLETHMPRPQDMDPSLLALDVGKMRKKHELKQPKTEIGKPMPTGEEETTVEFHPPGQELSGRDMRVEGIREDIKEELAGLEGLATQGAKPITPEEMRRARRTTIRKSGGESEHAGDLYLQNMQEEQTRKDQKRLESELESKKEAGEEQEKKKRTGTFG